MENLNPNEERKEIHEVYLKKDKKHRQLIKQAILKGKDPQQIIAEIEKLDITEYNGMQSPQYITAIKEKRKRLKETLDRILKMHEKDDPLKWAKLKNQMDELEKKRLEIDSYFKSVSFAELVKLSASPPPPPPLLPPSGNVEGTFPQAPAILQIPMAFPIPQKPLTYVPQPYPQPMYHPYFNPPTYKTGPSSSLPQKTLRNSQRSKDPNFGKATIEKKPELRNLREAVVKFVPMSLRVKKLNTTRNPLVMRRRTAQGSCTNVSYSKRSIDDSVREFMQVMKPLIS